jgi:hypothetical protein
LQFDEAVESLYDRFVEADSLLLFSAMIQPTRDI